MIKIKNSEIGDPETLTVSKIAKYADIAYTSSRLWNVINYLTKVGIIKNKENIGTCKVISIDKDKLDELIEQQDNIIPIIKYFRDQYSVMLPA